MYSLLISISIFTSLAAFAEIPDPFAQDFPCQLRAKQIAAEWGGKMQWRNKKTPTTPYAWATPTNKLGSWIYLSSSPESTVLKKINFNSTLVAELKPPACQVKAIIPQMNTKIENEFGQKFTDSDLQQLIENNESGFIYVWSPKMPLSIEGLAQFKQALKGSKHHLTVLIEPNGKMNDLNPKFFSNVPPSERRRLTSSELLFRDVQNHYPAIVFYKKKEIHSVIKYGYEKSAQYAKDINFYDKSL